MRGLRDRVVLLRAIAVECAHEDARAARGGALARVVGRARIDHDDVVAECERLEARVDAIGLVEGDD